MKYVLLVLMSIWLTACGDGDLPVSHTAVVSLPVRVCLYGDSTQAGNPHTGLLESLPEGSTVRNLGVPGLMAQQHLFGVPGLITDWNTSIRTDGCDLVVQNYGINDAVKLQTPPEEFADQVMVMRQMALAANKRVIIESPNPITAHQPELVAAYAAALRARLGDDISFVDQHSRIQRDLPNWQAYLPDGVHPDNTMYAFKTSGLIEAIRANLNKTR